MSDPNQPYHNKGFAPAFGYMERLVDTTERKGGINKAGQRGS